VSVCARVVCCSRQRRRGRGHLVNKKWVPIYLFLYESASFSEKKKTDICRKKILLGSFGRSWTPIFLSSWHVRFSARHDFFFLHFLERDIIPLGGGLTLSRRSLARG